jgi:ABC-type phosphate/phosphonate transport system ATPase subunit
MSGIKHIDIIGAPDSGKTTFINAMNEFADKYYNSGYSVYNTNQGQLEVIFSENKSWKHKDDFIVQLIDLVTEEDTVDPRSLVIYTKADLVTLIGLDHHIDVTSPRDVLAELVYILRKAFNSETLILIEPFEVRKTNLIKEIERQKDEIDILKTHLQSLQDKYNESYSSG